MFWSICAYARFFFDDKAKEGYFTRGGMVALGIEFGIYLLPQLVPNRSVW